MKKSELDINLEKLQRAEIDILKTVTDFCDAYGFRYYLVDGTLLGAVRHGGIIPWDDDIDIAMPRSDYDVFVEKAAQLIPAPLSFQNYRYTPGYKRPFTRIINENIKVYIKSYEKEKVEPAWIDVFPLDGMPNNMIVFQLHKLHFLFVRMLYHFSTFDQTVNLTRKDRTPLLKALIWFEKTFKLGRNLDTIKLIEKMEKILKKYGDTKSKKRAIAYSAYLLKETYDSESLGQGKRIKFDKYMLNVPDEYDKMLTQLYGDYMTFPPPEKRTKHIISKIEFLDQ